MQRWEEIVRPHVKDIQNLINVINSAGFNGTSNGTSVVEKVLARIDGHEDEILDALPAGYGDEIRGIQKITKIEISQLILYQFSYEILGLCTSVVAQDAAGEIWHARNLDFGQSPVGLQSSSGI